MLTARQCCEAAADDWRRSNQKAAWVLVPEPHLSPASFEFLLKYFQAVAGYGSLLNFIYSAKLYIFIHLIV